MINKDDDKKQTGFPTEMPQSDNTTKTSPITNVIEKEVFPSSAVTPCSQSQCDNITEIIACEAVVSRNHSING